MVNTSAVLGSDVPRKASLLAVDPRTRRRNAAEARFKIYGIIAIVSAYRSGEKAAPLMQAISGPD